MSAVDILIRNWLIGFKGPVTGCTPFSDRIYFKLDCWFTVIFLEDERRALTIAKALSLRTRKLIRDGLERRQAGQQAIGELYFCLFESKVQK